MTYAIIEDEQLARQRLQMIVAQMRPQYRLTFEAETVEQAVGYFQGPALPDLVFMDIELADGNCFDIFREVEVHTPIIFTTAYDEYTLQAFKQNSIDYLLKPLKEAEVHQAITKFEHLHQTTAQPPMDWRRLTEMLQMAADAATPRPASAEAAPARILTISGDTYSYAQLGDVAFFQSEDDYVYAWLHSGKCRMTTFHNLQELEAVLPAGDFFQLSRAIVANIQSIAKVSKYFRGRLLVKLRAGDEQQEVTVSATRRDDFLAWMGR